MNPSFPDNQARTPAIRLFCCAALLLVAAACIPSSAPSLTDTAAPYRPVRIAGAVPSRPGSLAWSPDGSQLAIIDRTVTIIDAASGGAALKHIDIAAPRYLSWANDGTLHVLSHEADRDILIRLDASLHGMTRTALDRRADAVYPAGGGRVYLLSLQASQMRIGTDVRCTLSLLDLASAQTTTLHSYSRIVPATNMDEDLLFAWSHAGPNPLDGSFLIMEHIKPPALTAYTLIKALDPASGDLMDVSGLERRSLYASASWSPDGRQIALTDFTGRLFIRGSDDRASFDGPALGRYPSWHPYGDRLMVGGTIINVATGEGTQLVTNSVASYAQWSPDGTRLAVATQGEVLLFENFAAPGRTALDLDLKKKLTLLQELLRGGLITEEDYRARRSRLLQDKDGGQP